MVTIKTTEEIVNNQYKIENTIYPISNKDFVMVKWALVEEQKKVFEQLVRYNRLVLINKSKIDNKGLMVINFKDFDKFIDDLRKELFGDG